MITDSVKDAGLARRTIIALLIALAPLWYMIAAAPITFVLLLGDMDMSWNVVIVLAAPILFPLVSAGWFSIWCGVAWFLQYSTPGLDSGPSISVEQPSSLQLEKEGN